MILYLIIEMVVKRNQPLFRVNQKFKKSDGFLKMDIFKNVQNRKVKESFEKDVQKLRLSR